jgi:hypothetical protein
MGPQSPAVPLDADNTDEAGLVFSKESTAGDDMMNMLAAAAEDTLRREEQQKAMESEDRARDDIPPTDVAEASATSAKASKRKRKGANEPKNPLGAFVCKSSLGQCVDLKFQNDLHYQPSWQVSSIWHSYPCLCY